MAPKPPVCPPGAQVDSAPHQPGTKQAAGRVHWTGGWTTGAGWRRCWSRWTTLLGPSCLPDRFWALLCVACWGGYSGITGWLARRQGYLPFLRWRPRPPSYSSTIPSLIFTFPCPLTHCTSSSANLVASFPAKRLLALPSAVPCNMCLCCGLPFSGVLRDACPCLCLALLGLYWSIAVAAGAPFASLCVVGASVNYRLSDPLALISSLSVVYPYLYLFRLLLHTFSAVCVVLVFAPCWLIGTQSFPLPPRLATRRSSDFCFSTAFVEPFPFFFQPLLICNISLLDLISLVVAASSCRVVSCSADHSLLYTRQSPVLG